MDSSVQKSEITFCAGAGSVTGANFLFLISAQDDSKKPLKILIDCGLEQGGKIAEDANWEPFLFDPKEIDALFITHAHIDHIGRIPKLIYDGFTGKIFSTDATKDLTLPMLLDTVAILGDSRENNLHAIYTEDAVRKIMGLWQGFTYHEPIVLGDTSIVFRESGHILGSAMVEFSRNGKKVLFTGDLGNSPSPILRDTETITDIDYLVMESVYGDRNHEDRDMRRELLKKYINENFTRKGTLVIPTFSLERTQELLFEIDGLVDKKEIPEMRVYLDSPLGIHLTQVYRKYTKYMNDKVQSQVRAGDDPFSFPGLRITLETDDSKQIVHTLNPKVIIAGSGMSNGGRIVHHEKNYLPNTNNTLLLTGYQSVGTLGRFIEDGAKSVTIMHTDVPVRAHVEKISGYSGHKDSNHLVSFVGDSQKSLKKVFIAMGEPKSALFLAQRLHDEFDLETQVPLSGDKATINF